MTTTTVNSIEKKYFALVPHVVFHKCETVYEFTLWCVYQMVAGEQSICHLSTTQLAHLAMMSKTQLARARKSLLNKGLIIGALYREQGFLQSVWHITIPDLMPENIAWRVEHSSLLERVDMKKWQRG